jgi:predicted RNA-binding Zn-ribbon protein involved in translation (DUF1610 family)
LPNPADGDLIRAAKSTVRRSNQMLTQTQPQVFPCPNCGEIINDSMTACRFCSVAIDAQAAATAAQLQSRINRAYSDASFLRTAAGGMLVFLGLSFLPIIQLLTYWGFIITFFVVLVLLVRWQIKFGRLPSSDVDYRRAKRLRTVSLLMWLLAIGLFLLREFAAVIILLMRDRNI